MFSVAYLWLEHDITSGDGGRARAAAVMTAGTIRTTGWTSSLGPLGPEPSPYALRAGLPQLARAALVPLC